MYLSSQINHKSDRVWHKAGKHSCFFGCFMCKLYYGSYPKRIMNFVHFWYICDNATGKTYTASIFVAYYIGFHSCLTAHTFSKVTLLHGNFLSTSFEHIMRMTACATVLLRILLRKKRGKYKKCYKLMHELNLQMQVKITRWWFGGEQLFSIPDAYNSSSLSAKEENVLVVSDSSSKRSLCYANQR